jgi:hypothetical protein
VFLQPLADGPVHADVVVHGMYLDCARSWTRSRTSCGRSVHGLDTDMD